MSSQLKCDGCGAGLYSGDWPGIRSGKKSRLIHGERDENSGVGLSPLPNGDFDWCEDCAKIAFQAVKEQRTKA